MRKPLFLQLRAPPFRIKFPSLHVFADIAPGRHSLTIYIDYVQKYSIWGPLLNPVAAKTASQIYKVAPKCDKF